ncbi:MAG: UbiA prenyltransferase family protein [Planctomycetota bacterium]
MIRLARPSQWLKSAFIFMPVPFAYADGAQIDWVGFLTGALGFSLVSSSIYVMNDLLDAPRDRLHPTKRERPIASGRITRAVAIPYGVLLLAAGTALVWSVHKPGAVFLLAIYLATSAFYCIDGKNLPLVDVFLLSAGFLLRVLFGTALIPAPASSWLLLCASTLALFLAFTKRRSDLVAGVGQEHRPSLAGYNMTFLNQAMGFSAGIALFSYALYSMSPGAFIPGREFASLPFAAFGILEFLRRAYVHGEGGSAAEVIWTSPPMLIAALGWVLAVLWSLDVA